MPNLIVTMNPSNAPGGPGLLTLADLRKEVHDAVGKTTIDWQRGVDAPINDALQLLVTEHPWTWALAAATLATVADQNYVLLPEDFAVLHTLRPVSGVYSCVPTSWDQILLGRASAPGGIGTGTLQYAARWGRQAGSQDLPRAQLELWPTPAGVSSFALVYRRLMPTLADADAVPDLPVQHHQLLRQLVRAEALRYDDQTEQAQREMLVYSGMLADHKALDGQLQQPGGRLQGAVNQLVGRGVPLRPHNSIGFA